MQLPPNYFPNSMLYRLRKNRSLSTNCFAGAHNLIQVFFTTASLIFRHVAFLNLKPPNCVLA